MTFSVNDATLRGRACGTRAHQCRAHNCHAEEEHAAILRSPPPCGPGPLHAACRPIHLDRSEVQSVQMAQTLGEELLRSWGPFRKRARMARTSRCRTVRCCFARALLPRVPPAVGAHVLFENIQLFLKKILNNTPYVTVRDRPMTRTCSGTKEREPPRHRRQLPRARPQHLQDMAPRHRPTHRRQTCLYVVHRCQGRPTLRNRLVCRCRVLHRSRPATKVEDKNARAGRPSPHQKSAFLHHLGRQH